MLNLLSRIFFLAALTFAGFPAPASANSPEQLTYPAIGFWNGFLSQLNVIECSNYGAASTAIDVQVKSQVGTTLATSRVDLGGFETKHVVLNSLAALTDSYGTYLLSAADARSPSSVRCMTSVYRLSTQRGREVDYAYVLPVQSALNGAVSGLFNSMNPSGAAVPVYNWLTIYNPTASPFRARLELYQFDGSSAGETDIELAAFERRDIALGHNNAANQFQNIGMYRIVPESLSAAYFASLVRYGAEGSGYTFAFPLTPSAGSSDLRSAFAATVNNALNWAEIANAGDSPAAVTIRIRDRLGIVVSAVDRVIAAHAQSHLLVNSTLGEGQLGTLEVEPRTAGAKLLLQNLYYGRAPNSAQLVWAYVAQDNSIRGGPSVRLGFPANTFLGMANWMKLRNSDGAARNVRLESFLPAGEQLREELVPLAAQGAADVAIHERFGANNVGFSYLSATDQTVGLQAEVLRVFLGAQGDVQSVMYIPPAAIPEATAQVSLQKIAGGLSYPVAVTHSGDGSGRLFITEREGRVRVVAGGVLRSQPFLDISQKVTNDGEMGLLSVAFHPQYAQNGKFYAAYSETNYDTVVSEFSRSNADPNAADPASEREILRLPQPHIFHKGGQLSFGPDGYLYVSFGDGGFSGDPFGNGQNLGVLYGKILRLDVSTYPYRIPSDNPFVGASGARGEIWAYGFRNPWRFAFDRSNGLLYAGDVGENSLEEVDIVRRGENYGWSRIEGTRCLDGTTTCNRAGITFPITEYPHPEGVAIVGGGVYRGAGVPALQGKYLFGDYVAGRVWTAEKNQANTWVRSQLLKVPFYISAFGEDEQGEMYLVNFFGEVYRFTAAVN